MTILQVIPTFGMGGAENMCETLSYELVKLKHKVLVVSLYTEKTIITERLKSQGIEVVFLDKKSGFDISCIKRLKDVIKHTKPDVIHSHLYSVKYAILATIGKKIKIIHTIHNVAQKDAVKKDRIFNGFFFKTGKVISVDLSEDVKLTVLKEYKIKEKKVPVVLNGVNLSKCIQKVNYDINGTFRIINVARFNQQKNHRRLIDAFKMLNNKYQNTELHLLGDGELRTEIEQQVLEYGLQDKVKFLGIQSNVYQYLIDSDCFVLSSDYEGVPMSLIEAMGTGLPIVSTNVGGIPNMIKGGEEGLLCELDPIDLAKNIEILYKDISLRKLYGKKALQKSIEYGSVIMAKNYLRIYSGNNYDD